MILTGADIERAVKAGELVISPFSRENIEPNSYGFHLSSSLIRYVQGVLDAYHEPLSERLLIPVSGLVLEPGNLYLGSTVETMGSDRYAATLYGRRSTSTMGMWIQFSAPLGHTGAKIPWTLEISVTHPVIVYAGMPIGKIAFWNTQGQTTPYQGKYTGSTDAVASLLSTELPPNDGLSSSPSCDLFP
jgi:dCTP deaminase